MSFLGLLSSRQPCRVGRVCPRPREGLPSAEQGPFAAGEAAEPWALTQLTPECSRAPERPRGRVPPCPELWQGQADRTAPTHCLEAGGSQARSLPTKPRSRMAEGS